MLYDYCRCWVASGSSTIANKGAEITGDRGIVLCGCCGQGNISFITGYGALVTTVSACIAKATFADCYCNLVGMGAWNCTANGIIVLGVATSVGIGG